MSAAAALAPAPAPAPLPGAPPLLEARGLVKRFGRAPGPLARYNPFAPARAVLAVDGVDLAVAPGESVAVVGESGCGKSTLGRLIARLLAPDEGTVAFDGADVTRLSGARLKPLRRGLGVVFQDPYGSLNPRMSAGALIAEPLGVHGVGVRSERRERARELLALVGLPPEAAGRLPHEFSGGQRQRLAIARALAAGPRLLLGDEPVSALDVSVQAGVLNLLDELKRRLGLALVLISHDLAVVRHLSQRVVVMHRGRVVEEGPADALVEAPLHPYARALVASVPVRHPALRRERPPLPDEPPAIGRWDACHYASRCPHARAICAESRPPLEDAGAGRRVACHRWREIGAPPPLPLAPPSRGARDRRLALYRAAAARAAAPAA